MVKVAGLLAMMLWDGSGVAGTVVNGKDGPVTNMNSGGYTFANPNLQAKKQYDTDYGTRYACCWCPGCRTGGTKGGGGQGAAGDASLPHHPRPAVCRFEPVFACLPLGACGCCPSLV